MVLNDYREQADLVLLPLAKRLVGISPNTLSYISLLAAVLAGASFALSQRSEYLLLPGFLLTFISSILDALDGRVARLIGEASARGDLLDHVFDRYADIFILGGITLSPYCPTVIGFIAIITVLLISYMGTQAQAMGVSRNYGGLLGRADRLMLIMILVPVQFVLIAFFAIREIGPLYPLGWLMAVFIIIGNINAVQRLKSTWDDLEG